jgi:phytoene dehydrogenase-like protein
MIEFALQGDEDQARQLFQRFREALTTWMPQDSISFRDWLEQYTENRNVIKLFQGFCAALMGTNLHEIPAGEFFRFLKHSSRGSRFGLAAQGNGDLMETLATAIEDGGCVIRRRTACKRIVIENGNATGIVVHSKGGGEERIGAEYVVSNTGPVRTIQLAGGEVLFEKSYLARLQAMPFEAPIIHISFVTDRPLIDGFAGSLVFGNTKNLIYLEIPSIISPALAPEGKFLHTAYGAPRDAARPDLRAEAANTLRELEENFPGTTEQAEFIVQARHCGQAPGMHRWPGYMMPVETPIRNLFNVGDGCTPPGTIGTEGSAASAKAVSRKIAGALSIQQ